MNNVIRNTSTAVMVLVIGGVISFGALASDLSPSDQAYKLYRCDALTQLGRMTDAYKKVCDELLAGDFDLLAWEGDNVDQSIQLREEIFSEFF